MAGTYYSGMEHRIASKRRRDGTGLEGIMQRLATIEKELTLLGTGEQIRQLWRRVTALEKLTHQRPQ